MLLTEGIKAMTAGVLDSKVVKERRKELEGRVTTGMRIETEALVFLYVNLEP